MQQFEKDYAELVKLILTTGEVRKTRNGYTKSLFGHMLKVPMNGSGLFPILQGRRMYPKGVLGELAAMLRKPTSIKDFEKWGCNYWKLWAKEDGSICVDYGNAWHADGQIERLKSMLANNPHDRRMIINGWRPNMLNKLDLPCCHLLYQFYVREGKYLDMNWYQRSVDTMIGLPSDIIFAAAWLIAIANEFGYVPGCINMMLGDCHIYAEHFDSAEQYLSGLKDFEVLPSYMYTAKPGKNFCEFEPTDIILSTYQSNNPLQLELKL